MLLRIYIFTNSTHCLLFSHGAASAPSIYTVRNETLCSLIGSKIRNEQKPNFQRKKNDEFRLILTKCCSQQIKCGIRPNVALGQTLYQQNCFFFFYQMSWKRSSIRDPLLLLNGSRRTPDCGLGLQFFREFIKIAIRDCNFFWNSLLGLPFLKV